MKKKCFYYIGINKIFIGFLFLGLALGIILKPQCKCMFLIGTTIAGIGVALIVIGSILLWTYKRLDDLMKNEL
ncbi:MAG: hypothetical protein LBI60_01680 [Bacteroidales bacterium]|jgi:hypothetical protein|nr:hypothetical protein [Bacteroidales bacterium]